jgi:hypothetical protein
MAGHCLWPLEAQLAADPRLLDRRRADLPGRAVRQVSVDDSEIGV